MTESPVIHVVDDDAPFRSAIGRLLRLSGYDVVLHDSAADLLKTPTEHRPNCILLDVQMPGLNGLEVQQQLSISKSTSPIIFLSGQGDIPISVRALKAGAEDFLCKPVAKKVLLEAIERALTHYKSSERHRQELEAWQSRVATLTPREREVFDLVVHGQLNKQIAHQLGTSERTIKAHRQKVMQKLNAGSLAHLVSMAEHMRALALPDNDDA